MQQLTTIYPAEKAGSASIIRKLKPQQKVSAIDLAKQHGMEFPSTGLPIVME